MAQKSLKRNDNETNGEHQQNLCISHRVSEQARELHVFVSQSQRYIHIQKHNKPFQLKVEVEME